MSFYPVDLLEAQGAFRVSREHMLVGLACCCDLLCNSVPFLGVRADKVALDRAFIQRPVVANAAMLREPVLPLMHNSIDLKPG